MKREIKSYNYYNWPTSCVTVAWLTCGERVTQLWCSQYRAHFDFMEPLLLKPNNPYTRNNEHVRGGWLEFRLVLSRLYQRKQCWYWSSGIVKYSYIIKLQIFWLNVSIACNFKKRICYIPESNYAFYAYNGMCACVTHGL